jgi:hypothetical protein
MNKDLLEGNNNKDKLNLLNKHVIVIKVKLNGKVKIKHGIIFIK